MPNPSEPDLLINDAAKRCGLSPDTIRRRLRSGQFPRSFRDEAGAWRVPLGDLVSAGLRPGLADQDDELGVFSPADVEAQREELGELRMALAVAEARLDAAAEVTAAHESHIADLRSEVAHLRSGR